MAKKYPQEQFRGDDVDEGEDDEEGEQEEDGEEDEEEPQLPTNSEVKETRLRGKEMIEKARAELEAGEALLAKSKEWDKAKKNEAKQWKRQESENQKAEVEYWKKKAQNAAASSSHSPRA